MKRVLLALTCGLCVALPAAAQFQKPEDAIKYRQSALTVMGNHFGRIAAMAQGRIPFDAKAAAAMGIINRAVPAEALEQEVAALSKRLSNGATQAFARAKKLINQSFVTPIDKQLNDEIAYFAECASTNDFKEGVTAFVEKREPHFEGN